MPEAERPPDAAPAASATTSDTGFFKYAQVRWLRWRPPPARVAQFVEQDNVILVALERRGGSIELPYCRTSQRDLQLPHRVGPDYIGVAGHKPQALDSGVHFS